MRHTDLVATVRRLSPLDLRVRAFNNVDSYASTPFTSCPTKSTTIPRHMYDWVVATYLGVEVPSLVPLLWRPIEAEGVQEVLYVDPHGENLGLVKKGSWATTRHDIIVDICRKPSKIR